MARQAKPKNEAAKPEPLGGVGHNSGEMTDEQRAALFFQHRKGYEAALAKKKETDAAFRNACKLAKSELGDHAVDDIKTAILFDTEEGEAKVKAQIDRQLRVARWMAIPLGSQADMFGGEDRTPAVDRARAEGKRDGLAGVTLKPPYDPSTEQCAAYSEGWHEGQAVLAGQIGRGKGDDSDLRPGFLRNGGGDQPSAAA